MGVMVAMTMMANTSAGRLPSRQLNAATGRAHKPCTLSSAQS